MDEQWITSSWKTNSVSWNTLVHNIKFQGLSMIPQPLCFLICPKNSLFWRYLEKKTGMYKKDKTQLFLLVIMFNVCLITRRVPSDCSTVQGKTWTTWLWRESRYELGVSGGESICHKSDRTLLRSLLWIHGKHLRSR